MFFRRLPTEPMCLRLLGRVDEMWSWFYSAIWCVLICSDARAGFSILQQVLPFARMPLYGG